LVGITYRASDGSVLEDRQFHGLIDKVDAREGFRISLLGDRKGEVEWLPPDTRAFQKAKRGDYRLKSTGEVVVDPDYTTTWTFKREK